MTAKSILAAFAWVGWGTLTRLLLAVLTGIPESSTSADWAKDTGIQRALLNQVSFGS